ncbi:hypothetical protein [Curtobacterium sp. MCPF17_052]|uniref:hypothetical protein n=1 Tax=Curtobacterium sp. MCPF17_052 TaxID=2175655 RepID=UPI0024DFFF9F|nr:hypothetical protein [Curtobacterium sp. MCPF17_052]WIB12269.1 hypothetical protein DEJ36_16370 [Curtobacterium sp. MCPF17_052]
MRTQLISDTRRFLSIRQPLPATAAEKAVFTTDLPQLLRASAARDATVRTLAAALGSGPAGAVVALQFLLAALLLRRARPQLELLSARGASPATIRMIAAALVLPAVVPAALVGGALAVLVSASSAGDAPGGHGDGRRCDGPHGPAVLRGRGGFRADRSASDALAPSALDRCGSSRRGDSRLGRCDCA